MAVKWKELAFTENVAGKTSANWSKSIGSGGDYATWAAMIADMPDLIAHTVTVTIKAGTTLTETCNLRNKHGLTNAAKITIQAEKYFPTSGVIPTADSATATTLRDAALATAALGDDYFNGCWVFVVDGTGTDNGFVAITDYVDATGDVVVASWPGTQPDNTSRYLIVGALIDGNTNARNGMDIHYNSVPINLEGIGINETVLSIYSRACFFFRQDYCGHYKANRGCSILELIKGYLKYCGIVDNNILNNASYGGVTFNNTTTGSIQNCCISDNDQRGVYVTKGSYVEISNNSGNANGTWGTLAASSGQANIWGTECSGSSGNHSDPGTAGTASADQAAAY